MAKLGLLYLNNGTWNDDEIISAEYITQSHYPHAQSQFSNYGYQWWIDFDGIAYNARGTEGQYIHVVPEYNIVVAMTQTADEHGEDVNRAILEFVLEAVLNETTTTTTTDDFNWSGLVPIIAASGAVLIVIVIGVVYLRRK
jgi:CubicO group peptidase (beta-lactamase class C family)